MRRTVGLAALGCTFLGLLLAGCGGNNEPAPTRVIESPGSIRDDRVARIASDGESLWFARSSVVKGDTLISVYEYTGESWRELPSAGRSKANTPMLLISADSVDGSGQTPCLGDTNLNDVPRVRCLNGGRWQSLRIPGELAKLSLADLRTVGRSQVALFSNIGLNASQFQLARIEERRLVPLSEPITVKDQILGALGDTTTDASSQGLIDIGFMGSISDQRWVATLHPGGGWSHTPVLREKWGSLMSGPVRTNDSLLMAVNEINLGKPWPLSIYERQGSAPWTVVEGKPLTTRGQSQGGVYPVGDEAWVIWNQMMSSDTKSGGLTPARVVAGRIDGDDSIEIQTLWKGKVLAPTDMQVIEYHDEPAFLYFVPSRLGTRAVVNFVSN